jgi:hypothetical protein
VYLGLVFFIDSLYSQTCTDLILPASVFPHFTHLFHPTSLNLPDVSINSIDRYQHFREDCCILHSRRNSYSESSCRFLHYIGTNQTVWHVSECCNVNICHLRNLNILLKLADSLGIRHSTSWRSFKGVTPVWIFLCCATYNILYMCRIPVPAVRVGAFFKLYIPCCRSV